MKKTYLIFTVLLLIFSCKSHIIKENKTIEKSDFTIAFGSCNKQYKNNIFWDDILNLNPNVFIWGGDNIYADTDNMTKLQKDYTIQKKQKGYTEIVKNIPIMATWDDHDYGINDGGVEFKKKKESQQLFLDFIGVPSNSPRRDREGIYHSKIFNTDKGSVNIIVLDTRYFRTSLTKSTIKNKRYQPNEYGEGTILGKKQWEWLATTLQNSKSDFTVLVSSIQILSNKHGFEKWANFPHEVDKLFKLIKSSNVKNAIILSGDRHISEFSKIKLPSLNYPIIDFTSSGLTHSYSSFKGEENPYRIGNVVSDLSFGVLQFNFKEKTVTMQMRGNNNSIQQKITQTYP